jgi:hypothetical protein
VAQKRRKRMQTISCGYCVSHSAVLQTNIKYLHLSQTLHFYANLVRRKKKSLFHPYLLPWRMDRESKRERERERERARDRYWPLRGKERKRERKKEIEIDN